MRGDLEPVMAVKKVRNGLFAILVATAIVVLGMGTLGAKATTGIGSDLGQSTNTVGYFPASPVE